MGLGCGFHGIPMVQMCVSASVSVCCTFSLANFPVWLFSSIPVCLIFNFLIYHTLFCFYPEMPFLFSNKKQKGVNLDGRRDGEEVGRDWEGKS